MTCEDFKNELIQHTKSDFEFFSKFQNIIIELTDAMHEAFKKNSIKYYAMYGSLLGLIRDHGIIPWDSDCDVVISVSDVEKAHEALQKDLPEDMYIVSNLTSEEFRYNQIRVCKKGYDHALHVDIYYCYGVPEEGPERNAFKRKAQKLYKMKSKKNEGYVPTDSKIRNMARKANVIRYKLKYALVSNKSICRRSEKLLHKYPLETSKYCACFSEEFHPLEKAYFGTPVEFDYDGHKIMIPEHPDYFLKSFFGNYNEYLSFEERYKEYKKGLERLHKVERNKK